MKYVLDLLKKDLQVCLSVLDDKDWGRHKDEGMERSWREKLRQEVAELRKAIKILRKV